MKMNLIRALLVVACLARINAMTSTTLCPSEATDVTPGSSTASAASRTLCKFAGKSCPPGWMSADGPLKMMKSSAVCYKISTTTTVSAPGPVTTAAQESLFRQLSCDDVVGMRDAIDTANKPHLKANMETFLRFACEQSNKAYGAAALDCDSHVKLSGAMNAIADRIKDCTGLPDTNSPPDAAFQSIKSTATSPNPVLNAAAEAYGVNAAFTSASDVAFETSLTIAKPQRSLRWELQNCKDSCTSTYQCIKKCGGAISSCSTALWFLGGNFVANKACIVNAIGCFKNMDNCCGCAAYYDFISCDVCDGGGGGGGGGSPQPPPPPPPPPALMCHQTYSCRDDGQYLNADCQSCSTCPPGTGANGIKNNYLGCPQCSAGKYSTGGQMHCYSCPAGKHSNNMASECYSTAPPPPPPACWTEKHCAGSSYLTEDCAACRSCEPGSASMGRSNSYLSCQPCPVGKYQSRYGADSCDDCKSATSQGSKSCTPPTAPRPPPSPMLLPRSQNKPDTWECVADEVYPVPATGPLKCNVACKTGKISVVLAWWGTSTGTFPDLHVGGMCGKKVTVLTKNKCNGKRGSCLVDASNTAQGGDPCPFQGKKLIVDYKCI